MQTKLFEIRDRGTCIPVMATAFTGDDDVLFRAAGYGADQLYVIVAKLDGVSAQYDPFGWPGGARTMQAAHSHILANWRELENGQVIDVEYILRETTEPKRSQYH